MRWADMPADYRAGRMREPSSEGRESEGEPAQRFSQDSYESPMIPQHLATEVVTTTAWSS